MGQPYLVQENFRVGKPDGAEPAHTFWANLNANITAGPSQIWVDGAQIFLRFTVANTGDKAGASLNYPVEIAYNGGSYANVGNTGPIRYANNATYLTHGNSTTNRLGGSGTFDTSNFGVIENTYQQATANALAAGTRQEVLIVLQLYQSDLVNNGDYYDIRVAGLNGWTNTLRVTVAGLPTAIINQTGWRFGADASFASPSWLTAVNNNLTVGRGRIIQLYVELEESAGVNKTAQYELAWQKNGAGGYVSLAGRPFEIAVGSMPAVFGCASDFYANDDAVTSNPIGVSAKTFTNGVGVESTTEADVHSSSRSLNNQCTVLVFTIRIPSLYGTAASPGTNNKNDYFDFQLRYSTGTALDTTLTARYTLGDSNGHIGGCPAETQGKFGPWKDGNGNLYYVTERSEVDNHMCMMKSVDNGVNWVYQDLDSASVDLESVDAVQVGNTIHIFHDEGGSVRHIPYYDSTHGSTPDTFGTSTFVVSSKTENDQGVAAEYRTGTADFVVFYRNGTNNEEIWYVIGTPGSWSSPLQLDSTNVNHIGIYVVKGSDSDWLHIFYTTEETVPNTIRHRSMNPSDNSLSASEVVYSNAFDGGSGWQWAMCQPVAWDNGTNDYVGIVVRDDSNNYAYFVKITDDGTPGSAVQIDNVAIMNDPGFMTSRAPIGRLFVDSADNLYFIMADLTTQDLWIYTSDDDGATWTDQTTPEEIKDGMTIEMIIGQALTLSGAESLAYVYADRYGGFDDWVWFDTYSLTVPPLEITPSAAGVVVGTVAPTVYIPLQVTPSAAGVVVSTVDPSVYQPLEITPSPAGVVVGTVAPTVYIPLQVTPSSASAVVSTVNPTVVQAVYITPSPASVVTKSVVAIVLSSGVYGGTAPSGTLLDDFNRADGAIGKPWRPTNKTPYIGPPDHWDYFMPIISSNRAVKDPAEISSHMAPEIVYDMTKPMTVIIDIADVGGTQTAYIRLFRFYQYDGNQFYNVYGPTPGDWGTWFEASITQYDGTGCILNTKFHPHGYTNGYYVENTLSLMNSVGYPNIQSMAVKYDPATQIFEFLLKRSGTWYLYYTQFPTNDELQITGDTQVVESFLLTPPEGGISPIDNVYVDATYVGTAWPDWDGNNIVADTIGGHFYEPLEVTPPSASAVASTVDPTVETALIVAPAPCSTVVSTVSPEVYTPLEITGVASVIVSVAQPSVIEAVYITPTEATSVVSTVNPSVEIPLEITPTSASVVASVTNPIVVEAFYYTPAPAIAITSTAVETIVEGFYFTPAEASTVVGSVNPVVQESLYITPSSADVIVSVVSPDVVESVFITPASASAIVDVVDPSVYTPFEWSPSASSVVVGTVAPQVGDGVYITPSSSSVVVGVVQPDVYTPVEITPSAVSVISSTSLEQVIEAVYVTPAIVSAIVDTIDPTYYTEENITPAPAGVVVGSEIGEVIEAAYITPSSASTIVDTQDPSVVESVYISPNSCTVVVSGVDPVVYIPLEVVPASASVIVSVVSPDVVEAVYITTGFASVIVSTVDPEIYTPFEWTAVATVVTSSVSPLVEEAVYITPEVATAVCSTADPSTYIPFEYSPTPASVVAGVVAPQVGSEVNITPPPAYAVVGVVQPDVYEPVEITPAWASVVAQIADPDVVCAEFITPSNASTVTSTVDPTVIEAAYIIPQPCWIVCDTNIEVYTPLELSNLVSITVVDTAGPSVYTPLEITPNSTNVVVGTIDPTVIEAMYYTPVPAGTVVSTIGTVFVPLELSGLLSETVVSVNIESVFTPLDVTPAFAWTVVGTVDPEVQIGFLEITPPASSVVVSTVAPIVAGAPTIHLLEYKVYIYPYMDLGKQYIGNYIRKKDYVTITLTKEGNQ